MCDDIVDCSGCADYITCPDSSIHQPSRYQLECEAYELYGDPMRDHYDHEENARYDRYDGRGDPDPCPEDDSCPDCGDEGSCPACVKAREDYDQLVREQFEYAQRCAASTGDDDVPF
jgi:hypothetical protein